MAKKKSVKKKPARKKNPPKQNPNKTHRPVFGFHVPAKLKEVKIDHIIQDECEEGYWGE